MFDSLKVDKLTGDLAIVDSASLIMKPSLNGLSSKVHVSCVFSGDMLDLLKWRVHLDRIIDCLSKLKDIDGTEIVKVKTTYSNLFLPLKLQK